VTEADQLKPLLEQCFAQPGVHVIDVPIDYSDNERVLNRDIKRLSAQL
jgi:acetolactate synthase I/II/III large subunit